MDAVAKASEGLAACPTRVRSCFWVLSTPQVWHRLVINVSKMLQQCSLFKFRHFARQPSSPNSVPFHNGLRLAVVALPTGHCSYVGTDQFVHRHHLKDLQVAGDAAVWWQIKPVVLGTLSTGCIPFGVWRSSTYTNGLMVFSLCSFHYRALCCDHT
jgi:hypothetical protein